MSISKDKSDDESTTVIDREYSMEKENGNKNTRLPVLDEINNENALSEHGPIELGTISRGDFLIWTAIPAIGIIFCLLHAKQGQIWNWTGTTTSDAQTLKAKAIISIMSSIAGGCVAASLTKAVLTFSFAYTRYRGAPFAQFVTMLNGYSYRSIPILVAGQAWFSVASIVFIIGISVLTKQLAAVSMGVSLVTTTESVLSFTPNYTICEATPQASALLIMDAFNGLRNPNISFTNEYFDRDIPSTLQGISNFERVLTFANVSCIAFTSSTSYNVIPNISNLNSAWNTVMTVALHDEDPALLQWVNCSILLGHATAFTSCNNTKCQTQRASDITPYVASGNGINTFLTSMFSATATQNSTTRNPLLGWLLGGDITATFLLNTLVPGESLEVIQNRTEILATVAGRTLCEYNNGDIHNSTTPITSVYETPGHYWYHVLWVWPFYLVIGFLILFWIITMYNLWMSPESRVMSIEWLFSQYMSRDRYTYLSGTKLVLANRGSLFQVTELDAKRHQHGRFENVIGISNRKYNNDISTLRIDNNKQYL